MSNESTAPLADRLLDKREVSQLLGVSVRTVERLVKQRRLAFRRVGATLLRFTRSDVEAYIDSAKEPVVMRRGKTAA